MTERGKVLTSDMLSVKKRWVIYFIPLFSQLCALCYHFIQKKPILDKSLGARSTLVSLLTPSRHLALCLALADVLGISSNMARMSGFGDERDKGKGRHNAFISFFFFKLKIQEMFLRWARAEQRDWTAFKVRWKRVNKGEIIHNYRQSCFGG